MSFVECRAEERLKAAKLAAAREQAIQLEAALLVRRGFKYLAVPKVNRYFPSASVADAMHQQAQIRPCKMSDLFSRDRLHSERY